MRAGVKFVSGFANLCGICVRGRRVRQHPGRSKHRPVLVAAAAVLTVRVEAEAHPPASSMCAPRLPSGD